MTFLICYILGCIITAILFGSRVSQDEIEDGTFIYLVLSVLIWPLALVVFLLWLFFKLGEKIGR